MRRTWNTLIALAALVVFTASLPAADKPLKLCLLSGCPTYHSEKSLPPFQEWLEKNYPVKCTRLTREGGKFPDLAPPMSRARRQRLMVKRR